VLRGFTEDRWSLDEPLKASGHTLVFCHRLLSAAWRRSFSHQCCEASLASPLSSLDLEKLETLLASDRKLGAAFQKYQTAAKPIDRIANLRFGEITGPDAKPFSHTCEEMLAHRIAEGLTMDDVLQLLHQYGLASRKGKLPSQATLQLISPGHELRGGRFLYRRYRTLAF